MGFIVGPLSLFEGTTLLGPNVLRRIVHHHVAMLAPNFITS